MYITAQMLRDLGASRDQVDKWPSTKVSLSSVTKVAELGLDIDLLAHRLLPFKEWVVYHRAERAALVAYYEARDAAWEVYTAYSYGRAFNAAARAYHAVLDAAWQTYQQATITALLSAIQGMTT